eukprot:m.1643227 g.1643227  ORF g.1643227 m.1643227 type:complete len:67 (-) comp57318_c0_seq1:2-202(-)
MPLRTVLYTQPSHRCTAHHMLSGDVQKKWHAGSCTHVWEPCGKGTTSKHATQGALDTTPARTQAPG